LWFDDQAEEAADFYCSIFRNSRIGRISRYGKEGREIHGKPEGSVMVVEFEIEGQAFTALNGGPMFTFNEAISFQVQCDTQEEVDYYWERLSQGGDEQAQQCGWLKDRYGVSWQIIPKAMNEMMLQGTPEQVERLTQAFLKMKKFDLAGLQKAYAGD
jgi:predicted 3-demethylubiquinone-9 3-methyltransferase (glyoxalase superfamily)